MISEKNRPAYRQRRHWKKEQVPKKYRGTYELSDEATAIWQQYLTANPDHQESRECAGRLLNDMEEDKKLPFLTQLFQ